MKSMNSGTAASVALPDRSSRGMMMSTSTPMVAHSCALKNLGLYGVAVFRAAVCAACACVCACCASASVHAKPAAAGAAAEQPQHRSSIGFHDASRCVPALCARRR